MFSLKTCQNNPASCSRLLIFCFYSFALFWTQCAASQPNIIYINVDDLGWADLSCQGSKYYETPNIDSLAEQGMRFTSAYAPASNCSPSRACCMTGQYTPRHGVYTVNRSDRGAAKHRKLIPTENTRFIQPDSQTIADRLRLAGYRTCSVGKWHISKDPKLHGFEVNIAGNEQGHPKNGGYFSPFSYPNCVASEPGINLTDRLTDEALTFIEKSRAHPFFLYLPYYAVHTPIQSKKDLRRKYASKATTAAHSNPSYAAMIENLDSNVGRLIDKLRKLQLANNTFVVFTSDNGGVWKISKQWPLRAGKGAYYEGGIRVPLIVRWPRKIAAGAIENTPVSGIDLFPTFAAAANVSLDNDKQLDGVNIMPLLMGTGELKNRPLFWHFPIYLEGHASNEEAETRDYRFRTRPGSVVRLGKWKLHEYFEDAGIELYNLEADPGEKRELSSNYPEVVSKLHKMLKEWRDQIDAPVPTKLNPKYKG